jgi:hypothetical protein
MTTSSTVYELVVVERLVYLNDPESYSMLVAAKTCQTYTYSYKFNNGSGYLGLGIKSHIVTSQK